MTNGMNYRMSSGLESMIVITVCCTLPMIMMMMNGLILVQHCLLFSDALTRLVTTVRVLLSRRKWLNQQLSTSMIHNHLIKISLMKMLLFELFQMCIASIVCTYLLPPPHPSVLHNHQKIKQTDSICICFGYLPSDGIKTTFENTTQYARLQWWLSWKNAKICLTLPQMYIVEMKQLPPIPFGLIPPQSLVAKLALKYLL
jgi:hypothetical protein